MSDEIRNSEGEVVTTTNIEVVETPTGDAEKGAMLGGIGGMVTGAIAGTGAGPAGTIIGAVVGGVIGAAASGAAVAAVDRIDDDSTFSGLPDDMSIDSPESREPMIVNRDETTTMPPLPLEQTPSAAETPIGMGVQEAITSTTPSSTPPLGSGLSPDQIVEPTHKSIDGGWERDNDANQTDINPSGSSYAYVDEPKSKE